MKRQLLYVIFILFSSSGLLAQAPAWAWAKHATSSSPETAWDVVYDSNSGDIYTGGYFSGNLSAAYGSSLSTSYGSTDGFVARYDQSGNVVWALKIGGTGNDEVHSVACDGSGNVYVSGFFTGTADFDPTAATFTLASSGQADGFLAKYSSTGTLVWATKFGGSNDENSWKMYADGNGIYLTGSYESSAAIFYSYSSATTRSTSITPGQVNTFGAKYNSGGVVQWVVSGGSAKDDMGFSVVADANDVFFIGRYDADLNFKDAAGTTAGTLQAQQNNKPQVYILSVTQAGVFNWQNNITSSTGGDMVLGWSITQDASDLYVTGYFDGNINFKYPSPSLTQSLTSGGNLDLFLAKLGKATGTFSWNASVTGNGNGEQIGRALEVDAGGNVVLGGVFTNGINYSSASGPNHSSAGGHDIFVTSYSNTGSFLWSVKAGGNLRDYLNGLAVDGQGNIFACGEQDGGMVVGTTTLQTGGGNNVWLAKLGCAAIANNTITATQTICAGSAPATFTGSLPTGGTTYSWQSSANNLTWTAAAGTSTAQNYSAPGLTATTYFRRVVTASGSCSLSTLNSNTITVFVNTPPSTAVAGTSQSICATVATMAATSPTSGTGLWSLLGGAGTISAPSSFSSAITGLGVGTNSFVWTVSSGVCPTSTAMVTILRYAVPSSNAGSNQTVCASISTLAAVNPTVGTGVWSVLSGTATLGTPTSFSSAVSGLSAGTNQFVWTVSNGICTAATSTVTITRDLPPTSNAGANQTVCATSATLAATAPTIGTGFWSVTTGTATLTSAASSSSAINGLSSGTNQFVWTVSNGSCPTASSAVIVIRNIPPTSNAGGNQTICASASTLAATNPTVGSGVWSVLSGTATLTSPSSFSSAVTGLSAGANQFVWTVANGNCTAATSTLTVYRDLPPTSNAGTTQVICSSSATLAATMPTIGTGLWSLTSGTGTITTASSYSSALGSLGTGTNQFLWTVSNGSCPTATSLVSVIRNIQPTSNAGTNQTICATVFTLAASNPTVGTGLWTVISGTASLSSATTYSSLVTGLSAGLNQFVWTVSNGPCTAAASTVNITRNLPPTSNAGTNQAVCSASLTLAALSPTIGTGTWTQISGSGTIAAVSNPSTQVNGIGFGATQFVWTVTNQACASATSTVTIIRDIPPTANAGTAQSVCASSVNLSATVPTVGVGSWSVITGSASLTASGSYSSSVTSLSAGQNQFLWTVTGGACPNATSAVTITRDLPPTATAGVNQSVCANSATLTAVSPTLGSGLWSVLSGSATLNTASSYSSGVTGLSAGTNQFLWSVTNGSCPSATSAVSVVRDLPPSANAGTSQTICTSLYTLAATNPTVGSGSWTVLSGTASISASASYSSSATGLSTGQNQFLWTVTNGSCPSATSAVTIWRNTPPTANAGTSQSVCSATVNLAAVTPTVGNGAWSIISGTSSLTAITNPSSQVNSLSFGPNQFLWTVSNMACNSATATVTITRDTPPTANAGTSNTICSASYTLAASTPTIGVGSWSVVTGSASITSASSSSSQVTGLSTGTNQFLWTVTGGSCPSATSMVTINRDALPTANAGFDNTVCVSSSTLLAQPPTAGTGSWALVAGSGSLTSPASYSCQVTGLSNGSNTFEWTVTNGVCPAATASVSIFYLTAINANAGTDQVLCSSETTLSATLPANATGLWSVSQGSAVISNPASPTASVSSLATGTNVLVWTITNGSCPTASASIYLNRDELPQASAGSNQSLCSNSATLAATAPSLGVGLWTLVSGNALITSPLSSTTQVTSLDSGDNQFIWTVTNGVCPAASATVTITKDAPAGQVSAGSDFTVCASAATLSASYNAPGNAVWTVYSGNALFTASTSPTSGLSNLNTGLNQFIFTNTNGSCPAESDTVNVFVTLPLAPASAGNDLEVCATDCTLSATNASGVWTVLSGNAILTAPSNPASAVTALSIGTNVLIWTVSQEFCPSTSDTLIVVRNENLGTVSAGPDQVICGASGNLAALPVMSGQGTWTSTQNSNLITNAQQAQTAVEQLSPGINTFIWTVTNANCPVLSDTVLLTSDAIPSAAVAGKDLLVCQDNMALEASVPAIGSGNWTLLSGTGTFADSKTATTTISGLTEGLQVLVWTVGNGVCPQTSDTVRITRTFTPITPDAGFDQVIETSTVQLTATIPQEGLGTWSVIAGSAVFSDIHDKDALISSLPFGNTVLKWTIANKSCPDVSDDLVIRVKELNIPNAFSPNGDGINDKFVITSLAYYKEVKLSIFNTWGTLLYHNPDYQNEWGGTGFANERLADDTYYYIIEIPGLKNVAGFVIIKQTQ